MLSTQKDNVRLSLQNKHRYQAAVEAYVTPGKSKEGGSRGKSNGKSTTLMSEPTTTYSKSHTKVNQVGDYVSVQSFITEASLKPR